MEEKTLKTKQFETNYKKLLEILDETGMSIGEYALQTECAQSEKSVEEIKANMESMLNVMQISAEKAAESPLYSVSGLTGGDAFKYKNHVKAGNSILGNEIGDAVAMALSCSEVNASMNRIVACPTAGSCGIVPSALLSIAKKYNKSKDEIVMAMFTAAGVGIFIGTHASLAGAQGGCQAECGSASAMAAAAIVEMLGGSVKQAFNGAAVSLKNIMGLVCDPVAGLVEIPCIKRNASGVVNALLSADIALAGVQSYIPFDEVVWAMNNVGNDMSHNLKETALGGIAITPTAIKLASSIKGEKQ